MAKFKMTRSLLLALLSAALWLNQAAQCQADEKAKADETPVQPAFPQLISQDNDLSRTIRIVTETSSPKGGAITTQEEYLDLNQGKAAYVLTDSQEIVYSSALESLVFKYKPYTCEVFSAKEPVFPGLDDWSLPYGDYSEAGRRSVTGESSPVRIFGVAAMWLWAAGRPKVYSLEKSNYVLSKQIFTQPHLWVVANRERDFYLEFRFVSQSDNSGASAKLYLENIKMLALGTKELIKSINVLSIDYTLSNSVYENLLSIPAGYNCVKFLEGSSATGFHVDRQQDGKPGDGDQFWSSYAWANSRVTFEVTATKLEPLSQVDTRMTDTVIVEIGHALVGQSLTGGQELEDLMMTRIKSTSQETRTILNHLYSVAYHIDSARGSCYTRHLGGGGARDDSDEVYDELTVVFLNGLVLSMHKARLREMFTVAGGASPFKTVKMYRRFVGTDRMLVYRVLERPSYEYMFPVTDDPKDASKWHKKVVAREMQTLVQTQRVSQGSFGADDVNSDDDDGAAAAEWKLESHTIWLLDKETESKILATFHINVIDEQGPLDTYPDVAGLFDVSEECYLSDASKKSGKDYAWIELTYPLSSRQLDMLLDNESKFKQAVYNNLIRMPLLTSFSLPRLEVMFSDEALILRLLILDLPRVDLLYDSANNMALIGGGGGGGGGDDKKVDDADPRKFTVPDVGHCAKLCEMYACLTMTFCQHDRTCLVSARPAKIFGEPDKKDAAPVVPIELAQRDNCVSYGSSKSSLAKQLKLQRLSNVIGAFQHQDYDALELPAVPDEVALPRDETGVNEADYRRILAQYVKDISKYLAEQDHRIPSLTISLMLNGHFVVALPTKFTVENDPLDEMALDYTSSGQGDATSDGSSAPASTFQDGQFFDLSQIDSFFHEGLPASRFDINRLIEKQAPGFRRLSIGYDQCALACLDSKCGTFSHCSTSSECVLTNVATIKEVRDSRMDTIDDSCVIMQRDYVQSYQKFPNVQYPSVSDTTTATKVGSLNDCALQCASEKDYACLSFEFCAPADPKDAAEPSCFRHDRRHPESIYTTPAVKSDSRASSNTQAEKSEATSSEKCDHYERSYLAEFTQVEGREIAPDELAKLKTTEFFGKTTFDCADACLNELSDCSAFQFCFELGSGRKSNYVQTCTMIQSQPKSETERQGIEALVDSENGETIGQGKLLVHNNNCRLFALKPNSLQAHLRDLAMGQTMTTREQQELARRAKTSDGYTFTWPGFIMLIVSLLVISTLVGYGLSWARVNNETFRNQIDRLRILIGA